MKDKINKNMNKDNRKKGKETQITRQEKVNKIQPINQVS